MEEGGCRDFEGRGGRFVSTASRDFGRQTELSVGFEREAGKPCSEFRLEILNL